MNSFLYAFLISFYLAELSWIFLLIFSTLIAHFDKFFFF